MKQVALLFYCLAFLFFSCKKSLKPSEYNSYVHNPSNGLLQVDSLNGMRVTCFFRPLEHIVMTELLKEAELPEKDEFEIRKNKLSGLFEFTISLEGEKTVLTNLKSNEPYLKLINYFNTEAQKDFILIQQNDSFPCLFSHFEQSLGNQPKSLLIVDFEGAKRPISLHKDFHLLWRMNPLTSKNLRFFFRSENILAIPEIKF